MKWTRVATVAVVICLAAALPAMGAQDFPSKPRILVAVNTSEWKLCSSIVASDPIARKERSVVQVGECDQGAVEWTNSTDPYGNPVLTVTFHSSVVEDASPPSCDIPWTKGGSLVMPSDPFENDGNGALPSPLPGCFTMDSREGFHMTSYWFYALDSE